MKKLTASLFSLVFVSMMASFALAKPDEYKVMILPANENGAAFQVAVIGPDEKIIRRNASWGAELKDAAVNSRKLEIALNSGKLKMSDIDQGLMQWVIAAPSDKGEIGIPGSKTWDLIQRQKISDYRVYVLPQAGFGFAVAILGPRVVKIRSSVFTDEPKLDKTVLMARKLEKALNIGDVDISAIDAEFLSQMMGVKLRGPRQAADSKREIAYASVVAQELWGYKVQIAMSGKSLRMAVTGPEGAKVQQDYDSINPTDIDRAIVLSRRLESAMNVHEVWWSDVSFAFLDRLNMSALRDSAMNEPESAKLFAGTVQAFGIMQRHAAVGNRCEAMFSN